MKKYLVVNSRQAEQDLAALYEYISEVSSPTVALQYLERLERYMAGFEYGAERGTRRNDIRPELRIVGFERRVTLAFTVEEDRVVFLRVFSKGQNWQETEHWG